MISHRPRLRVDLDVPEMCPPGSDNKAGYSIGSAGGSKAARVLGAAPEPKVVATPPPSHRGKHESTFRNMQLDLRVYSPSVKRPKLQSGGSAISLPVFGDHDHITGSISTDPTSCACPGRVTVSLEGAFLFSQPDPSHGPWGSNQKHVFFTSSQTFVTSASESNSPMSAASFRSAFVNSVRPRRIERRPSLPTLKPTPQTFPFKFQIPRPMGQEIPPTFNVSSLFEDARSGKTQSEVAQVTYTLTAFWEANDGSDRALIEAPIVFQPDMDFHSLDGVPTNHQSWLELPLRTDRSRIPLQCAITLPNPAAFSRSASIPFFVVFKTQPRSRTLSREIAADATIAVSLLRVVTINICRPYTVISPMTAPVTATTIKGPPSSWNFEEDPYSRPATPSGKLIKRMVKSAPPILRTTSREDLRKLASALEQDTEGITAPAVSETRTLQTEICIGFPKRPRHRGGPDEHPSLEAHAALPDGLFKGKMQLSKNMLPSIDWAGLNVKYYLDVSVLFSQDELRARVPVRIS